MKLITFILLSGSLLASCKASFDNVDGKKLEASVQKNPATVESDSADKKGGSNDPTDEGVRIVTEDEFGPGEYEDCPEGGKKITIGLDKNLDGILDPEEIEDVAYECTDGSEGGPGKDGEGKMLCCCCCEPDEKDDGKLDKDKKKELLKRLLYSSASGSKDKESDADKTNCCCMAGKDGEQKTCKPDGEAKAYGHKKDKDKDKDDEKDPAMCCCYPMEDGDDPSQSKAYHNQKPEDCCCSPEQGGAKAYGHKKDKDNDKDKDQKSCCCVVMKPDDSSGK